MEHLNVEAVAARLKAQSKERRKPRTYAQQRSVLDEHKYYLLGLDNLGCNGTQLQTWLAEQGITVARSTVNRWLHQNRQNG